MFIKITYTGKSGKKISGISLPESVDFKSIAELHIVISKLSPNHAVDFTWQFEKSLEPSFIKGKQP